MKVGVFFKIPLQYPLTINYNQTPPNWNPYHDSRPYPERNQSRKPQWKKTNTRLPMYELLICMRTDSLYQPILWLARVCSVVAFRPSLHIVTTIRSLASAAIWILFLLVGTLQFLIFPGLLFVVSRCFFFAVLCFFLLDALMCFCVNN